MSGDRQATADPRAPIWCTTPSSAPPIRAAANKPSPPRMWQAGSTSPTSLKWRSWPSPSPESQRQTGPSSRAGPDQGSCGSRHHARRVQDRHPDHGASEAGATTGANAPRRRAAPTQTPSLSLELPQATTASGPPAARATPKPASGPPLWHWRIASASWCWPGAERVGKVVDQGSPRLDSQPRPRHADRDPRRLHGQPR